jgi:hypothetical protein
MGLTMKSPEAAVEFQLGIRGGGTGTRALLAQRDALEPGPGRAGRSALGQVIVQAWRNGRLPLAVCGSIGLRLASRMAPAVRSRMVPAWRGFNHVRTGKNSVNRP